MNITVSSRMLGRRLREMRDAIGLTVRVVAAEMEYAPAKVTQQEQGYRPVSKSELTHLVTQVYGGDADTLERLEYLRQRSLKGRGWWSETGANLPEHLAAYIGLEDDAERVQIAATETIPGLLQTEGYARAQHSLYGRFAAEGVERQVAIRMRRQRRLTDPDRPLRLDAVISEGSLRRCGQHPSCDQIPQLIRFLERVPTIEVRVLPFGTGIHDIGGSFAVLTLPRDVIPPVGHEETAHTGLLVEDDGVVAAMLATHSHVWSIALPRDESLAFMRSLLPNGNHHGVA